MRPHQWTKNLLVFAGVIFGQKLLDPASVGIAFAAFGVFCLLSSAVYLINDVRDRDADRVHPLKSRRPIASGAVSPGTALTVAAGLAAVALAGAVVISTPFALVAAGYLALMSAYSLSIKHVVILDVLALAGGFVLRAAGGAVAVGVDFSHWLLLLTLLLALFLALSKRRAELVAERQARASAEPGRLAHP
jgi:4-hydroxybenzoate polyprenyltransferase